MTHGIDQQPKVQKQLTDRYEHFIFAGRWILAPVYAGLLLALVLYSFKFMQELVELCHEIFALSEEQLMVRILNLVDITMLGNLVLMIIIGGYSIFVRKLDVPNAKDRPQWLKKIDAGTLKVKMGMSLIGVSSIYLLKSFVESHDITQHMVWQVVIHLVFIISTITLAWTCKITHDAIGHARQQDTDTHETH